MSVDIYRRDEYNSVWKENKNSLNWKITYKIYCVSFVLHRIQIYEYLGDLDLVEKMNWITKKNDECVSLSLSLFVCVYVEILSLI